MEVDFLVDHFSLYLRVHSHRWEHFIALFFEGKAGMPRQQKFLKKSGCDSVPFFFIMGLFLPLLDM